MSIRSRMKAKARSVDVKVDLSLFDNAKHIYEYGATPNAVLTHALGSLCIDTATSDIYIKTDAYGGTAWSKIVE